MATIVPNADFDAEAAADELKGACQGFGTDEARIIRTLTAHDTEQRQEIKSQFKQKYGQDLEEELKSELGGDFEEAVLALMTPKRLYDAKQLHWAISGAGTHEAPIIEIMITRSNAEIEEIKEIYNAEYESELESDLMGDTGGYFRRLMVSQCNGARNEDEDTDSDLAQEEAQAIYDAGEGQMGTDESTISAVLCTRSWAQLRATFDAYFQIAERDIEAALTSETTGTLEDAYLAVVKFAKDPVQYFAERLNAAMSGGGTEDTCLIRIIVSRSEPNAHLSAAVATVPGMAGTNPKPSLLQIDLQDIKGKYEELYGKSLAEAVEGDCGGDYKRLLLAIIG